MTQGTVYMKSHIFIKHFGKYKKIFKITRNLSRPVDQIGSTQFQHPFLLDLCQLTWFLVHETLHVWYPLVIQSLVTKTPNFLVKLPLDVPGSTIPNWWRWLIRFPLAWPFSYPFSSTHASFPPNLDCLSLNSTSVCQTSLWFVKSINIKFGQKLWGGF